MAWWTGFSIAARDALAKGIDIVVAGLARVRQGISIPYAEVVQRVPSIPLPEAQAIGELIEAELIAGAEYMREKPSEPYDPADVPLNPHLGERMDPTDRVIYTTEVWVDPSQSGNRKLIRVEVKAPYGLSWEDLQEALQLEAIRRGQASPGAIFGTDNPGPFTVSEPEVIAIVRTF